MQFKEQILNSLNRTGYLVYGNKVKLLFFTIVALLLQFQTYSMEFKAKVSGTAQDIAQSVASAPIFLSVEMLIGFLVFFVITNNMKSNITGKASLFGPLGSVAYSLMFLIVNLMISLFVLGVIYTALGGGTAATEAEEAAALVESVMFALPLVMGLPYAVSAISMAQFACNSAIKTELRGEPRRIVKSHPGYLSGFATFFVSWKRVFTQPYYLILSIVFVLLVTPEIYMTDSMGMTLIPVLLAVAGHFLVLLLYLSAYDEGMRAYLDIDTGAQV